MDRGMTTSRPASADSDVTGMIDVADVNTTIAGRDLVLRMTTQTEVRITYCEHFCVDGTVGVVAARAAFTQRGVLVNEWQGLFAMALSAVFI